MFNVYMLITVYLVNLLWLTFNTPKKSSLLSPPLCSSNVRVCFHTMRSVSSQKHIFEIFAFHTFHTPAFSSPAFSTPAVWCRVFQSRVFQSRVFSRPVAILVVTPLFRGGALPAQYCPCGLSIVSSVSVCQSLGLFACMFVSLRT